MSCANSLTSNFEKIRKDHKELVSEILTKKIEYLDKNLKTEPTQDGFSNLLATFSSGGYCRSCGNSFHMFNKEFKCCMCKKSFCQTCLKTVKDTAVLEAVDTNNNSEEIYTCEKCSAMITLQQSAQLRRNFRKSLENSPLLKVYVAVAHSRDQLLSLITKHDYLSNSLIDSKNIQSEKEDLSFGASYTQVKTNEKWIMERLKDFQDSTKGFDTIKPTNTRESQLMANIKKSFNDFLQKQLPRFKDTQKKVAEIELEDVKQQFIYVKQLAYETQRHSTDVYANFKPQFEECTQNILQEVMHICIVQFPEIAEVDVKKELEERFNKVKNDPQMSLFKGKENVKFAEPTLMRKISESLGSQHKRFTLRRLQCPITAQALKKLQESVNKDFDAISVTLTASKRNK